MFRGISVLRSDVKITATVVQYIEGDPIQRKVVGREIPQQLCFCGAGQPQLILGINHMHID